MECFYRVIPYDRWTSRSLDNGRAGGGGGGGGGKREERSWQCWRYSIVTIFVLARTPCAAEQVYCILEVDNRPWPGPWGRGNTQTGATSFWGNQTIRLFKNLPYTLRCAPPFLLCTPFYVHLPPSPHSVFSARNKLVSTGFPDIGFVRIKG